MNARRPALISAIIALLVVAAFYAFPHLLPDAQCQYAADQGSIAGIVYDADRNPVSEARVTLYYTKFLVNDYVAADAVKSADNPQLTANGSTALAGHYGFSGLVPEVYIVTVEKDGFTHSEVVQLRGGTQNTDIVLSGYYVKNTASPTASSRPSATFTNVVPTVVVPGPGAFESLAGILRLALMAAIAAQLLAGIAIIVLRVGRRA